MCINLIVYADNLFFPKIMIAIIIFCPAKVMPKKMYIITQSVFNIQQFVSVTYTALLQFDVGVRILIVTRKKYLFRSLYTKNSEFYPQFSS